MSQNEMGFWGCFGVIAAAILGLVIGSIMKGWALMTMWGWFVAGYFDLPPLTIPQAIGIGMVVSFLSSSKTVSDGKKKDTSDFLAELLFFPIAYPLLSVAFAWIVLQFI